MNNFRCRPCLGLLIATMLLPGCRSSQSDAARQRESSHLRSLISLHNFATSKLGHRPVNETEFKSFIAANAKPMIDSLHLVSANELFVSERDGKPFILLYGQPPNGPSHDVVAYEQTGVAGSRLVGYSLGMIQETDEQEFAQLVSATSKH